MLRTIIACAFAFILTLSARAEFLTFLCDRDWLAAEIGKQMFEESKAPFDAFNYVNDGKYRHEDYAGGSCMATEYVGRDVAFTDVMTFNNGQEYRIAQTVIVRLIMRHPNGIMVFDFPQPIVRFTLALPSGGAKTFERNSIAKGTDI